MERKTTIKEKLFPLRVFRILVGLFCFGLGLPFGALAMDVTLQWDANAESDLAGYRVYYKPDSSGGRVLGSYNGEGLILIEESGTTRIVSSGFEVSGVSCHLSGLDPAIIYFFVVTAFDTEGFESLPSREVATDDIPPTKPTVLSGSQVPGERDVLYVWSPSTDPAPGSGLAGYSFVFDAFPDTTPDTLADLSGVTEIALHAPYDGRYWFHIKAVDKAGLSEPNVSGTEHSGPICVDTGPPAVDYASIDYTNSALYVEYGESRMKNAALQSNYSFDNGLQMLGDGIDVSGVSKVFSFPLNPATLERYVIYTMTVTGDITDCAGNLLPTAQRTINDDDGDGMADEWERLWFGDTFSQDGSSDSDEDGLTDFEEYRYARQNWGTWGANWWRLDPTNADSDGDDIPDKYEVDYGLNPVNASDRNLDLDNDGWTNYEEYAYGFQPNNPGSPGMAPLYAPGLVGLPQAEAVALIEGANLILGTLTEAYNYWVPSGHVISQLPAAGMAVPQGYTVDLLVSLGSTPSPQDAAGYWPFDEGSGATAFDDSGNGNDGSVHGAASTTSGKVGWALDFDGVNDRVQIPDSASLGFATNQMTLACWIYPTNLSGNWVTIMQRSSEQGWWFDWQLYARAVDAPTAYRPVFRIDWNHSGYLFQKGQVQGDVELSPNTWYHIAVTYDGNAMNFYIDGTLRGTTVFANGIIPKGDRDIWIGGNEPWGKFFDGQIDEVYIYDRALSQAEIQELMNSAIVAPVPVPDVVAQTGGGGGGGCFISALGGK